MPPTLSSKAPLTRVLGRAPPALWRLDSGAPMPSGRFVALVPGSEAPLVQLSLPAALKGSAREKVALRQAQDRLGARPGTLLFRPARLTTQPDDWHAVLIADTTRVAQWRAKVAGGHCSAILPDYLALPAAPELWTIELVEPASTEDSALVRARLGPADGFSAEPELAALMLARARADAQTRGRLPRAVLRLGAAAPAIDAALEGLEVARTPESLPRGVARPQVLGHGEPALDLATDPEAAARALAARLRALRLPAALLLAGGIGWAGGEWAETVRMNAHADAIEAATLDAVRRDILPSGPILDIEAQVMREIERRGEGAAPMTNSQTPLARLRSAAEVITEVADHGDGAEGGDPDALLQSVTWQSGGALQLELTLVDFAALDALVGALRAAGLAAQVGQSAAEADGRVVAGIVIGEDQ